MHASQIPPYEQFVAAYPLTSEGVMTMGSILVSEYARSGRSRDAERLATAASRFAVGTELAYIVEINRAYVEWDNGKHEVAEQRLRQIMAKPLPKVDDRRTSDILFVAPQQLADFLRECGRREESDRLYKELADQGFEWDKKHPNSNGVGESYVIAAYRGRIQLIVDHDPKDTAAEQRITELKKHLPSAAEQLTRELMTMRGQAPPMAGQMVRDSEKAGMTRGKAEGAQR